MAASITTKLRSLATTMVFGFSVLSGVAWASGAEETTSTNVAKAELVLGDETSDAMQTGTVTKFESTVCEKGTANLKVPGQHKSYMPEETP